jgi:hypothetical protein
VVHVSASPPLIPDSRLSRVRLAAIACPHRTFPHLPRLKRSLVYPPRGCGYTCGSAPSEVATVSLALCPDGVSAVASATYREPLCLRWPLPTAGWFPHHLRGHYPSFLAPTGSCAPPPSSRGFRFSYAACPCRLRRAPAGRWWFPTLSLRVCPSMLGPLPRRGGGCLYPLLPHHHRPSPSPYEVGSPQQSAQRLSSGGDVGAAVIRSCSGLEVCCHPGRSYRRAITHGAAVAFTSEQHTSRYLPVHRIC